MEPEVRERFERIEALLHAMAERENQMEIRYNQRMGRMDRRHEEAMRRMDRADQRMEKFDQRMEKFDQRLEVTRKLVEAGIKMVAGMRQRQKESDAKHEQLTLAVRELAKSQKAFLDSLKRGGNGSRHAA